MRTARVDVETNSGNKKKTGKWDEREEYTTRKKHKAKKCKPKN